MKQCKDGSWCCEAESTPLNNSGDLNSTLQGQVDTCCAQGKGVFIKNGIVTNDNSNATTTSSSATSTTTNTTSPTPAQHSTPVAAIAGGVVGGIIVLAIIALAIFFCLRSIRKNKARKQDSTLSTSPGYIPKHGVHEKYGNERVEADGTQSAPMMKYGHERFEADGTQLADSTGRRDGPYEI